MEAAVECTHCGVVMTSWSAPGSQIRYYQCPFCSRTHSSLYGEVFRRRAGARVLDAGAAPPPPAPRAGIPMASPEDVRWNRVKATAARWFERLEADEQRHERLGVARPAATRVATAPKSVAAAPRASRSARPEPVQGRAPYASSASQRRAATKAASAPEADPQDVVELRPGVRAQKP